MPVRDYLPSAKLLSIVLSLALAAGLVYAADAITRPAAPATLGVGSAAPAPADAGWEAALYAVQAQSGTSSIPAAPDQNVVSELLQAAQGPNITDSVGKTILISLTNAKSQGLGDDIPTQDQIIAAAAAQIQNQQVAPKAYALTDLTVVPASSGSLRAYGNAVMSVMSATSSASENATLVSVDYAVEARDTSQIARLGQIGNAYAALARALAAIPVPQTLAPLHLQAVNTYLAISATYPDLQSIIDDPLRGLVALRTYESLLDNNARVFTNIAQALNKGGILFSKDEPGSAWSTFLAPAAVPQ